MDGIRGTDASTFAETRTDYAIRALGAIRSDSKTRSGVECEAEIRVRRQMAGWLGSLTDERERKSQGGTEAARSHD